MTPEQREAYRQRWAAYFAERHSRLAATEPAYLARMRATERRWRKARPDLVAAREQRRRARKAAVVIEPVSRARVIERDRSVCYLCHRVLAANEITLDHVIPLVRGGPHTEANLRVACRPCNSRKGTRMLEEVA